MTVLSLSIDVEIDGRWPWQAAEQEALARAARRKRAACLGGDWGWTAAAPESLRATERPSERRSDGDAAGDPELTSFDIFVLALSMLSIINMALAIAPLSAAVHNVVLIVDGVLCLIFLTDFFARLAPHTSGRTCFTRGLA